MPDYGHTETDKAINRLSKKLKTEYSKASKEVSKKLNDYLKRFKTKDEKWKEWVEDGKKTKEQYKEWRKQQILVGKRWSKVKQGLADEYLHADERARNLIRQGQAEVYALNINYSTYHIEKELRIDTSFTQYNEDAFHRLLIKNPDMLPAPNPDNLSPARRTKKAMNWYKRQLQSVASQAVVQGKSIPDIADEVAKRVGESNLKSATRTARTMMTGAENAGKFDSYQRAKDMGINLTEVWIAVHDSRTRTSHRHMDGEVRGEDGYFSNGLLYPADPTGDDPAEIYNCRCGLRAYVKGFEHNTNPDIVSDPDVGKMTYKEWQNARPKSRDILYQRNAGRYYKAKYTREYGRR